MGCGLRNADRRYASLRRIVRCEEFDVGADHVNGEPIFVCAVDQKAEDHGYLIVVNYDQPNDRSEVLFIDAASMSQDPIARIQLPFRIPKGFHGSWLPWESIAGTRWKPRSP